MEGSASFNGIFASLVFRCSSLIALGLSLGLATGGCAGVKQMATPTGGGGQGGSGLPPPISVPDIPGLTGLEVTPESTNLALAPTGANGALNGTVQLTATGTVNGAPENLTSRVRWSSNLPGANVALNGLVTITAPGVFRITAAARAGSTEYTDVATITATFSGDVFADGFNQTNNNKAVLDGAPSGNSNLAYPLNESLFPPNLSPIHAHIQSSGAQIARLNFQQGCTPGPCTVNVNFYANCETGPGGGCYVRMPLTLTRLFIASSEIADIQLRARASNGGAPTETQVVNVAWASVPLSGGLYYWSVIPAALAPKCPAPPLPNPPNYCLLDTEPTTTEGTAVYRYAFSDDGSDPQPQQIWTDDGGPSSNPPYQGSVAAVNNNVVKGHCIGCHSISNDGKYMTLTIGGSAADAANFALLDIAAQTLLNINPAAGNDPNATPLQNPVEYWKKYRMEAFATESAWGPNNDRVVSMYQSRLYLNTIAVNGAAATAMRAPTPVVPSWAAQEAYATDPFWSQDGSLFVFTSFATPSVGMYNMTGLNGDMKRGGQIVIADANAEGIMDNARVLVGRGSNVTLGYPAISSDSKLVVFNESTCLNPNPGTDVDPYRPANLAYGNQSCDGYDDGTAKLWIVKPTGGASTLLARANGGENLSNSWPRFSPDKGTFRGQDLYWVAFSSRRPYGTQVNTAGAASAKPQLWIAGVVQGGEFPPPDPSFSPVWLPAQNPNQAAPNGNHVPQWVKVAVVIVQ